MTFSRTRTSSDSSVLLLVLLLYMQHSYSWLWNAACWVPLRQEGKSNMADTEHSIYEKLLCGLRPMKKKHILQFRIFRYFHMSFGRYQNPGPVKRHVKITQISETRWCFVTTAHEEDIVVWIWRPQSPADGWTCYQSNYRSPLWCLQPDIITTWPVWMAPVTVATVTPV